MGAESQTIDPRTIATVYVKEQTADQVVITLPGTSYQIHLEPASAVEPSPQGRVRGMIRCPGWKVDTVSKGGAYIEPVYGRPRRLQGRVLGALAEGNAIILVIQNTPVVIDLPERWDAAHWPEGTPLAIDVKEGSSFTPAD